MCLIKALADCCFPFFNPPNVDSDNLPPLQQRIGDAKLEVKSEIELHYPAGRSSAKLQGDGIVNNNTQLGAAATTHAAMMNVNEIIEIDEDFDTPIPMTC